MCAQELFKKMLYSDAQAFGYRIAGIHPTTMSSEHVGDRLIKKCNFLSYIILHKTDYFLSPFQQVYNQAQPKEAECSLPQRWVEFTRAHEGHQGQVGPPFNSICKSMHVDRCKFVLHIVSLII